MTCIHGLDDVNCPICRTTGFTSPINTEKLIRVRQNELRPISPLFTEYIEKRNDMIESFLPKPAPMDQHLINMVPRPNLINTLPDFQNRLLSERLNELNIRKSDTFGISKRSSLESPEWKFRKRE